MIKPICYFVEALQTAMHNGDKKAFIPFKNKCNFFDVTADDLEKLILFFIVM